MIYMICVIFMLFMICPMCEAIIYRRRPAGKKRQFWRRGAFSHFFWQPSSAGYLLTVGYYRAFT